MEATLKVINTTSTANYDRLMLYWQGLKQIPFGHDHVMAAGAIAKSLADRKEFQTLQEFLEQFTDWQLSNLNENERFRKALIFLKLHLNSFDEVRELIKGGQFEDCEGLLQAWDEVHYREKEQLRGEPLNPLHRFRVRKRNPPPRHILPLGVRPTRKLPENAKTLLLKWIAEHPKHPYPSSAIKRVLIRDTGLTSFQVKTWFANARRRIRNRTRRENNPGKPADNKGSNANPCCSSTSAATPSQQLPVSRQMQTNKVKSQPTVTTAVSSATGDGNNDSSLACPGVLSSQRTSAGSSSQNRLKTATELKKGSVETSGKTSQNVGSRAKVAQTNIKPQISRHRIENLLDSRTAVSFGEQSSSTLYSDKLVRNDVTKLKDSVSKLQSNLKAGSKKARREQRRKEQNLHKVNLESLFNIRRNLQHQMNRKFKTTLPLPEKACRTSASLRSLHSLCTHVEQDVQSPVAMAYKVMRQPCSIAYPLPRQPIPATVANRELHEVGLPSSVMISPQPMLSMERDKRSEVTGWEDQMSPEMMWPKLDQSGARTTQAAWSGVNSWMNLPHMGQSRNQDFVGEPQPTMSEVGGWHMPSSVPWVGNEYTPMINTSPGVGPVYPQNPYLQLQSSPFCAQPSPTVLHTQSPRMSDTLMSPNLPFSSPVPVPAHLDHLSDHSFQAYRPAVSSYDANLSDFSYRQLLLSQNSPGCYGYCHMGSDVGTASGDNLAASAYSPISSPDSARLLPISSSQAACPTPLPDQTKHWVVPQPGTQQVTVQVSENVAEADAIQGLLCLSSQSSQCVDYSTGAAISPAIPASNQPESALTHSVTDLLTNTLNQ